MKPCSRHKKSIALLQTGSLPSNEKTLLQAHLENCHGCKEYARELASVCGHLSDAAAQIPETKASGTFHARLLGRIRTETPSPLWPRRLVRRLGWSLAGLASAATVVLLLKLSKPVSTDLSPDQGNTSVPSPVATSTNRLPSSDEPTYSNYRLAARGSLDELDALLNLHATRNASSSEAFRAGQHGL